MIAVFLWSPATAGAATLTVGSSGAYATVADAIAASSSGDTIEVEAGSYAGCLDLGGRSLSVVGLDGSASTTLDGSGCAAALVAEAGETLSLEGFTVANREGQGLRLAGGAVSLLDVSILDAGSDATDTLYGGAISMDGGALVIAESSIAGGGAALGGGVFLTGGATLDSSDTDYQGNGGASADGGAIWADAGVAITSTRDWFEANYAESYADGYYGGAILLSEGASLLATESFFSGNLAYRGGAIYAAEGASVTLDTVDLIENQAYEHGGAIYGRRGLEVDAIHTGFNGNQALYGSGGAIYLYGGGALRFEQVQLVNSTAWDSGGAVYLEYGVSAELLDVELSDNTAQYGAGGAWYQYFYGALRLERGTVARNTAMDAGGALVVDYLVSAVEIWDSDFADNQSLAGQGGALWADTYLDLSLIGDTFEGNAAAYDGGAVFAAIIGEMNLSNVELRENTASEGDGGGLYMAPQDEATYGVILQGLVAQGNAAGGAGGGVYTSGLAWLELLEADLLDNQADGLGEGYGGGGIYVGATGEALVQGARVCGNQATEGGGVYLDTAGGQDAWHQVVIAENSASEQGGGLYLSSGSHTFVNNALLANTAAQGGGAWLDADAVDLRNSVIAWTGAGDGLWAADAETSAGASVRYNAWHDNLDAHASGFGFSTTADGNLEADPGFQGWSADGDCTNDDLSLAAGSALIDAGDPTLTDADCSASDIGPQGGPFGAFEDADGDGWYGGGCAASDCDDVDPEVNPGAEEVPDDGIDQDCDGADGTSHGDSDEPDDSGDDSGGDDSAEVPGDDTSTGGSDEGCGGCGGKGAAALLLLMAAPASWSIRRRASAPASAGAGRPRSAGRPDPAS